MLFFSLCKLRNADRVVIKGKSKYFTEGNLAKALLASSCIPLVFDNPSTIPPLTNPAKRQNQISVLTGSSNKKRI